ncbi:MAG: serine hydrolase domain-containing protein [Actinomycetales bacterium]
MAAMRQRTSGARRITVLVLASVVVLVLAGCTPHVSAGTKLPAQVPGSLSSGVQGKLETAMKDAMKLSGASGAMVGVWAPWAGSWQAGVGTTKLKGTVPVTADMSFRIADNTTPITCTVLLALADERKVGLDDQLSDYLPGFVGLTGVTLRELCQNTSGFGDYTGPLAPQFVENPTRQWPELELANDGIAAPAIGKPGEKYGPAATNLVLLGMALQNATGSSWQDLYNKYVFGRLGMGSSSLPQANQLEVPGKHPNGYATALNDAGAPICGTVIDVTKLSPSMGSTAFGAVSNLSDLKTFAQALATGALLSPASAKAQLDGISAGTDWQKYGLGASILGPMVGSVGALPGYLSAMFTDPVSGLTVVFALNNSTSGKAFAQALAEQLISIVAKVPAKQPGAKVISPLPWSEDQAATNLQKSTVCPPAVPAK